MHFCDISGQNCFKPLSMNHYIVETNILHTNLNIEFIHLFNYSFHIKILQNSITITNRDLGLEWS